MSGKQHGYGHGRVAGGTYPEWQGIEDDAGGLRWRGVAQLAPADLTAAALEEVQVPPGYLARDQQRAWRELLRHTVYQAILDVANAGITSRASKAPLAYLRDPENARLFAYAGFDPAAVAAMAQSAATIRRAARAVGKLTTLHAWECEEYDLAHEQGRTGGRQAGTLPEWPHVAPRAPAAKPRQEAAA